MLFWLGWPATSLYLVVVPEKGSFVQEEVVLHVIEHTVELVMRSSDVLAVFCSLRWV